MKSSSKPSNGQKTGHAHDSDAWSGWACMIGVVAGGAIGSIFGRAFVLGAMLGAIGVVVGAFNDRSRR